MKRWISGICVILAVAVLMAGSALADVAVGTYMRVANCNEFITLREEPSTKSAAITRIPLGDGVTYLRNEGGRFAYVNYQGQAGYVLQEYLEAEETPYGTSAGLSDEAYYNINLFLSNFTESSLAYMTQGAFSLFDASDPILVGFAIDHIWFNQQDKIETGDYFNGNNTRLADKYVNPVLQKYFGVTVENLEPIYMDYADGYYYWCETGGHMNSGFATLTACYDLGGDCYLVYFEVHGMGEGWNNDVCGMRQDEVHALYPDYVEMGCAYIQASDLNDRSTFTLQSYAQS